ncbi:hypothetical protein, partial [Stenotrophomonas maltophilia]|uniref:hypothetical protein n=1 Tax=Stenotrophomonas maltophilia TaxID=40324 RepID=UPI003BF8D006
MVDVQTWGPTPQLVAGIVTKLVIFASAVLLAWAGGHRRTVLLLVCTIAAIAVSDLWMEALLHVPYVFFIAWTFKWSAAGFLLPVLLSFPADRVTGTWEQGLVAAWWLGLLPLRMAIAPLWTPAVVDYEMLWV